MPTTVVFGSSAYGTTGGTYAGLTSNGTVTADIDDGVIDVGDAITTIGFGGIADSAGVSGGGYYLGNGVFAGSVGYVFGADPVLANNTAFFVVLDGNPPVTTLFYESVRDFALNPGSQVLGTDPACFCAGTLIDTPTGDRPVESLRIGDLVLTDSGDAVPVKWIGRQTVHKVFAGERARPVRISAGALGGGLPYLDLVLTPDHALILGDFAIVAGALVNGTTITLDPLETRPDRTTYYHVETDTHQAVLANGCAAETFVDAGTRRGFENFAEYLDLYGEDRTIPEMPLPRITSARLIPPAIRSRLGIEIAA